MAIAAYPQIVYDADHNFSGDLSLSPTADIQLSSGSELSNQRILRRLFTNPGNYIWHPDYGGGINQFVGQPLSGTTYDQINSNITSNIYLESTVASTPPAVIAFQTIQSGIYVGISYTLAVTLQPTVLNFVVQ